MNEYYTYRIVPIDPGKNRRWSAETEIEGRWLHWCYGRDHFDAFLTLRATLKNLYAGQSGTRFVLETEGERRKRLKSSLSLGQKLAACPKLPSPLSLSLPPP